jgi:hypothetical protein
MVTISPSDGACRKCGGLLHVIDANDCSMLVECEECDDCYSVEPDAFGDHGIEYWPAMLAELAGGE